MNDDLKKLCNGDPFRSTVARRINELIDAVRSARVTSVIGGTVRRSSSGTAITISQTTGGTSARAGSSGDNALYRGPFGIVALDNGTFAVCDTSKYDGTNPGSSASSLSVNGYYYSVPFTVVPVGEVYLNIDLTGDSPAFSFATSASSAAGIYSVLIGLIDTAGKIYQYRREAVKFVSPVTVDESVAALLEVQNNELKLNSSAGALTVPVVDENGKIRMLNTTRLPQSMYEEGLL